MMSVGKGIAILGIWVGLSIMCLAVEAIWIFGGLAAVGLTIYIASRKEK